MSDTVDKARAAVKRLKVFPLPSVVLLPGSAAPLHIFEPRYRAMIKDAVASDGIFAMAQVLPGQESLLPNKPQLEEMLCVGVITMNEELEDGRFNLVLVGVARARLKNELSTSHPYREVEAELLEDEAVDPEADVSLRRAVVELVARLPTEVGKRVAQVASRVSGGALADVVASTFMQDPQRRFEVLSETDVHLRMEIVTEELLMLVGHLKPRKPEGLMN
ncbi:MAG: LON peptidase substrate-binding domain-containing protein [Archangium sp.]|nr:LON peptidase substrate-binding domain-containing protein [Archangium sp.]MDP3575403.1 LON peptidase substrate-binding domain-containing protein [Archangium sp.]